MSHWAYIRGTITVEPLGRTQPEKRYILDTVLDHLPRVSGSEEDMNVYAIQKKGYNDSLSCDEFGECTNNLDDHGYKSRDGWLHTQDEYIIVVDGSLRDCYFEETMRQFMKWFCRLGKRVQIRNALVSISSSPKKYTLDIVEDYFGWHEELFEMPSWARGRDADSESNWCEYLMWDSIDRRTRLPLELIYKYYNIPEIDEEVERRRRFGFKWT